MDLSHHTWWGDNFVIRTHTVALLHGTHMAQVAYGGPCNSFFSEFSVCNSLHIRYGNITYYMNICLFNCFEVSQAMYRKYSVILLDFSEVIPRQILG